MAPLIAESVTGQLTIYDYLWILPLAVLEISVT